MSLMKSGVRKDSCFFAKFTLPFMKEVKPMHTFIAKNDKQLGLCLKLLYSCGIQSQVELRLNEKDRIIYLITVKTDDDTWRKLEFEYKVLIG